MKGQLLPGLACFYREYRGAKNQNEKISWHIDFSCFTSCELYDGKTIPNTITFNNSYCDDKEAPL
jgi:hypothetical protein